MKRRRRINKKSRPLRAIRLWTYDEVQKAVPYLRSVIGSLREHWLESLSQQRASALHARQPGRETRQRILEREALEEGCTKAEDRFNETLEELMKIDVFLLDPVRGIALIPFRKEDELAWYVYDQFRGNLSGWRFHNDPLEECRPLSAGEGLQVGPAKGTVG